VKRDLENALVGTAQALNAGASGTTARLMAGYQTQTLNTGAAPPSPTNSWAYTGAPATLPFRGERDRRSSASCTTTALIRLYHVTPTNGLTFAGFAATAAARAI